MFIEDLERQQVELSLREILGKDIVSLCKKSITIEEGPGREGTSVSFSFDLLSGSNKKPVAVMSHGHGFVDAIFNGLMCEFSSDYTSLKQISLKKFTISTKVGSSEQTASDSEVSLQFSISNNLFTFSNRSCSLVDSVYSNLLKTFEFYMNCEKSFLHLKKCVKDAEGRNRGDIISSCMYKMSNLTKMISYETLC